MKEVLLVLALLMFFGSMLMILKEINKHSN